MRIDIISAAPDLLESPFNYSIIKRAQEKKLAEIITADLISALILISIQRATVLLLMDQGVYTWRKKAAR